MPWKSIHSVFLTHVNIVSATCQDRIKNQGETDVDCGGPCPACPSCNDGIIKGLWNRSNWYRYYKTILVNVPNLKWFFYLWRFAFIIVNLGYTYKESHECSDQIGAEWRSNLNDAINSCNSNSQCNCIDHYKDDNPYYRLHRSVCVLQICNDANWEAWVITFIW